MPILLSSISSRAVAFAGALLCVAALSNHCAAQTPNDLPPCRAGMHVERVSPLNYGATILAVDEAKGSYQVKSDSDGLIDWVPAYKLRTSCVGVQAAAVTQSYFVGAWKLFSGPTPHHEVIDGEGYLVVGSGAHVPPLEIKADGTYVWTLDSHTVITGKWRALADNELRSGTKSPAIVLLSAESGKDWEVWKTGVNQGTNKDAISVDRMDLGLSYMGTRLP